MDYEYLTGRPTPKRSYNIMAQAGAPPPFLDYSGASRAPLDDHYHNHEHQPQRRRVEDPWHQRPLQQHFLGDGLDFRRPIMSAASMADAIDLTGDRHEHSVPQPRLATPGTHDVTAGTSSRAQRLPRYQRDIIDLADSDEEEQQHQPAQHPAQGQRMNGNIHMQLGDNLFMPQMPEEDDGDSLFIPQVQARPTTAGLRRVGSLGRRPTPTMDLDDVEIVSSRPLSRNPSRRATPAVFMPGQGATQSPANDANLPIDLTADDDDDVIHTDTRPIPSINGDRPAMAGSGIGTRERPMGGDFGIGRLVQRFRGQNHLTANFLNHYANVDFGNDDDGIARTHAVQRSARRRADHARTYREEAEERLHRAQQLHQQQPGRQNAGRPRNVAITAVPGILMEMDYGMVGFDLGVGVVEPPAPKYEPPPPAEKGFTRSPEEDEEVVCPNCGDELAVGKDEMKQQIWVVKSCGHAYCGECATRVRPTSTSKKGKGKAVDPSIPPPLKKCVVVGCEKPATKKDMIHVYMSN
ncbi:hypothetical protein Q7P35_012441 [Cladosporium inversicolor]